MYGRFPTCLTSGRSASRRFPIVHRQAVDRLLVAAQLVVGHDVLEDGLPRRAVALLEGRDGGRDHLDVGGVGCRGLGLAGLLRLGGLGLGGGGGFGHGVAGVE